MSLHFSYNIWFLISGTLLIAGFSLWIYRTTTPQVGTLLRRFLMTIRILSLFLLLSLFFEPQLQFHHNLVTKPIVPVLIDNSASMQLKDENSTRISAARNALQILKQNTYLNEYADVQYLAFSDTAALIDKNEIDSLKFNGDGTNLAKALQTSSILFQDKDIAATVLVSDGATNLGDDPATTLENYPASLYPIQIAQKGLINDIWIGEIITNEIAYAGMKIPVEIYVRSNGYANQQAKIKIIQHDRIVIEETITLPENGLEKKVILYLIPDVIGKQKYDVTIEEAPGELTSQNNQRAFYLNVLKNKLKIYLLAAAPSPDVAFVRQALAENENFSLQQTVAVTASRFASDKLPNETETENLDCIIAINFARSNTPPTFQTWLENAVRKHEKPVLFITGFIDTPQSIWIYRDLLFLANRPQLGQETAMQATLSELGYLHPLFKTDESGKNLAALFEQLPPIFSNIRKIEFQSNTTILTYLTGNRSANLPTNVPLLTAAKADQKRVITILGNNLWRWHMLLQRKDAENTFYSDLIENSVRWLASRDENKLLNVQPAGDIFRAGQQINFNAQAYYDDYRVREGLRISLKIEGMQEGEFIFSEKGDGIYRCKAGMLSAGDYIYKAQAFAGDKEVSADSGKFSIIPFQWELQRTEYDSELLEKLAHISSGKVIAQDSLAIWLSNLHFNAKIVQNVDEIRIWQYWMTLVVILILLSLEWFLRKQKGML
ncbi:MAG: VWA domain-containing protein [Deferribacteres bacterium]|nr:VWA domain-containing protein [candidate division KSB1 bacterium]MCB9502504.1 VWA domain-containing protein [Deferribacteres bacterium]